MIASIASTDIFLADEFSVRALVQKGDELLPNLTFVGHTTTPVSSSHQVIKSVVNSEFRLCNLPDLNSTDTSTLLVSGTYQGRSVGVDFHNEASVESAVMNLIYDILKALNLFDKFTVHRQPTQDVKERGDVFVLSLFGVVLLILKVKCPSEQLNEVTHRNSLGQVFDYLQINRECASIGYCFGVWTTYDSCRLIWLNDDAHNALASAEFLENNFKFPLPPDEYRWEDRQVCVSKVYKKEDNIPKMLACLIWKLYNSEMEAKTIFYRNIPSSTTKKSVKFRAVNDEGYFFQANNGTIENLTFRPAGTDTKQFYLIRQFNGRDGKVWLSINRSGRLAMVKFRKSNKSFSYLHQQQSSESVEDNENTLEFSLSNLTISEEDSTLVNFELNTWKRAYKQFHVNPFTVTLANSTALVMPFCFCYKSNGGLQMDLQCYLPCESDFATGFGDWEAIRELLLRHSSVESAVNNLFSAIKTLARKCIFHRDIKWEHLALLPVFDKNVIVRLEPILIDLAEVEVMSAEQEALSAMCCHVIESNLLNSNEQSDFEKLFQSANQAN